MVVSGFGPYLHLCPNNAPAECADIIPIPWAMMLTLGFGVRPSVARADADTPTTIGVPIFF